MDTIIRAYNHEDRNECIAAFKTNVPLYFTEPEVVDFEKFLTRIENIDANSKENGTQYYVILHEQKLIGCGGFGDKDSEKIITFAWGLIHKDYHKKGFGKQLLSYRLKQIEQLYLNWPVVLDTTQFSFPFFEKFGFETTMITQDYYAKGMDRYDMTLKTGTQ
jgi:N-acetylglutamate synthase-like GNAT family acetyltransferase